jgi:hydrogenase maturation protease
MSISDDGHRCPEEDAVLKALVLALGNSLKGDEGVAQVVLEELRKRLRTGDGLELTGSVIGGIALINRMLGFDKVLIIDPDQTPGRSPGDIHVHAPDTMEEMLHAASDAGSLKRNLELGEKFYPGQMPKEVAVIGIEVEDIDHFREGLTPAVAAAVPKTVEEAMRILKGWGIDGT